MCPLLEPRSELEAQEQSDELSPLVRLCGSVVELVSPFEPVGEDDWEFSLCLRKKWVTSPTVRQLTASELDELRRDMAESSAWAKIELRRRREEKSD